MGPGHARKRTKAVMVVRLPIARPVREETERVCNAKQPSGQREILGGAMTQTNVEIVRRVFDAAGRRDAATVFALYDPEVEFDSTRSALPNLVAGGRVYRGHEDLQRFFRERSEHMENIEDAYEELIDAGEQVVSVVTTRARGRASGVEVVSPRYAAVWTIRGGKIVRVAWFPNRAEALEAAGVRE